MLRTSIFSFGILFLFSVTVTAQRQFQTGPLHTGYYPDARLHNSVALQWTFPTEGAVRSTPAVSGDRLVFGSSDGHVYCVGTDGKERWRFRTDGPVSSSPALHGGSVFVISRTNTLYALQLTNGTLQWKHHFGTPLPYVWGFDYYVGSPTIANGIIYVGSADGHLYAVNSRDGSERWNIDVGTPIRSTPAVDRDAVYFGDCAGKVYAVNASNGAERWRFASIGDTLNNENFGFDRKAIISSPTLSDGMLFIGGRDGYLYALNTNNGSLRWRVDYSVSWVISTAAVHKGLLVTGTSDGRFVHALNIQDGKERWRFMTQATVWASPSIAGNDAVAIPSNDGYVYALELMTGKELWRYKIGPQIFSSPVLVNNMLYVGSDDGKFYSLTSEQSDRPALAGVKRAVFWMKEPAFQTMRSGMDVAVRDYFIREGYAFYDETDVKAFLLSRIQSDTASVLVFASNYFLPSLTNDTLGSNILQAYLRSGGRIVMLGMNPAAYQLDSTGKQIVGINFTQAAEQTGIPYRYKDLRTHGGFYSSTITPEGKLWGLKSPFVAIAGMPLRDITTALALDENGNATAWIKTFSRRKNSGYLQLYLTPDRLQTLPEIQRAAEYGLQ
jgi:outer membrane protein assembly factor BamB